MDTGDDFDDETLDRIADFIATSIWPLTSLDDAPSTAHLLEMLAQGAVSAQGSSGAPVATGKRRAGKRKRRRKKGGGGGGGGEGGGNGGGSANDGSGHGHDEDGGGSSDDDGARGGGAMEGAGAGSPMSRSRQGGAGSGAHGEPPPSPSALTHAHRDGVGGSGVSAAAHATRRGSMPDPGGDRPHGGGGGDGTSSTLSRRGRVVPPLSPSAFATGLEPEREPLGGERRHATVQSLTRKLQSRPSPSELMMRHVMRGSMGADPSLAATHEAVVRQQTINHLSRRLRDRATLDNLVQRGIWSDVATAAAVAAAAAAAAEGEDGGDLGGSDGGPDGVEHKDSVDETLDSEGGAPAHHHHRMPSGFTTSHESGTTVEGDGKVASTAPRPPMASPGVAGRGAAAHPIPVAALTPTARRAAAAATALQAKLRTRPSLQQLLQAQLIHDVMMWTQIELDSPSLPPPRNCHTLSLVGHHLVLLGGYAKAECGMGATALNVDASSWDVVDTASQTGVLPRARYAHTAVSYRSSFIVVFGGYGGGSWLNDTWICDAASLTAGGGGSGGVVVSHLSPSPVGGAGRGTKPSPTPVEGEEAGHVERKPPVAVSTSPAPTVPAATPAAGGGGGSAIGSKRVSGRLTMATVNAALASPTSVSIVHDGTGSVVSITSGGAGGVPLHRMPPRLAATLTGPGVATPSPPWTPSVAATPPNSLVPSTHGSGGSGLAGPMLELPPTAAVMGVMTTLLRPTCTWYQPPVKGDPPKPRAAHTAVLFGDGMVVFGGNDGSGLFNDVALCTLEAGGVRWSSPKVVGPAPSPRSGHTAVAYGNRMLVFGGGEGWGSESFNDLHILDTDLDATTTGSGGGSSSSSHRGSTASIITVSTEPREHSFVWVRPSYTGTPPSPRTGHAACMVGTNMLVFGGGDSKRALNDLYLFDVATSAWTRPSDTGAVPSPRAGHSATTVGNYMVIFGGCTPEGACYQDLYVLDSRFNYYSATGAVADEAGSEAVGALPATAPTHPGDGMAAATASGTPQPAPPRMVGSRTASREEGGEGGDARLIVQRSSISAVVTSGDSLARLRGEHGPGTTAAAPLEARDRDHAGHIGVGGDGDDDMEGSGGDSARDRVPLHLDIVRLATRRLLRRRDGNGAGGGSGGGAFPDGHGNSSHVGGGAGMDALAPLIHTAPSRKRRGFDLKTRTLEMLSAALADMGMGDADGVAVVTDTSDVDGEEGSHGHGNGKGAGDRVTPSSPPTTTATPPSRRMLSHPAGGLAPTTSPGPGGSGVAGELQSPGTRVAALVAALNRAIAASARSHAPFPTPVGAKKHGATSATPTTTAGGSGTGTSSGGSVPPVGGGMSDVIAAAVRSATSAASGGGSVTSGGVSGGGGGGGEGAPMPLSRGEVARRVAAWAARVAAAQDKAAGQRQPQPHASKQPGGGARSGSTSRFNPSALPFRLPTMCREDGEGGGGESRRRDSAHHGASISPRTAMASSRRGSAASTTLPTMMDDDDGGGEAPVDPCVVLSRVGSMVRAQMREDEVRYHAMLTALQEWRQERAQQTQALLRAMDRIAATAARTHNGTGNSGHNEVPTTPTAVEEGGVPPA